MEENKIAKVHRLPTEDRTPILVNTYINPDKHSQSPVLDTESRRKVELDSPTQKNVEDRGFKYQHLYFTNDEEIKEGDCFINTNFQQVYKANSENSKNIIEFGPHPEIRKIIATTDPKLTTKKCSNCNGKGHIDKDGFRDCHCKTGEVYNIAQPSQALIKAYCEQGDIDECDVEYEEIIIQDAFKRFPDHNAWRLKVDPTYNTITTHLIEEKMYSREEVKKLLEKVTQRAFASTYFELDEWVKENL